MITVLSISAFIIVAYMAVSFYLLERKKRGVGPVFTVWCFITGVSVMAMMFELSEGEWYQFLGLFADGRLGFVGAVPRFKLHFERPVHFVAAGTCAVAPIMAGQLCFGSKPHALQVCMQRYSECYYEQQSVTAK